MPENITALRGSALESMYQYGVMVKAMAATQKTLAKILGSSEKAAPAWQVDQYHNLRLAISNMLDEPTNAKLTHCTIGALVPAPTHQDLFVAAADLSAFVEFLLSKDAWITSYEIRAKQLAEAAPNPEPAPDRAGEAEKPHDPVGPGNYL